MMDPKDISELQHEEFYRYIAQAYDKPRFTLHYKTDAPLNIRSIFYVPEMVRCLAVYSAALGKLRVQVSLTAPSVNLPLWCRLKLLQLTSIPAFPVSLVSSSSNSSAKSTVQNLAEVYSPALPQWTLAALSSDCPLENS